ncbi:hypothetical protein Ahy_A03g015468 isoform A [Arachis hypogaea]|uniref:NADH:quinone oxidoreductase/Mrp antiporter membrane subunit domain-containing protein n=1 Tax=Arachis hypogaea TaxID=3818 RepID=A0A445E0G3_ARAHY|nr:hypothetical protein Ahy_A03g015468 isoform A [Arachis hypogaea]
MLLDSIQIIYVASTSLGYSLVSHTDFIMIGIGSTRDTGINGIILQIISHRFIGTALFFLTETGYDRLLLGLLLLKSKSFIKFLRLLYLDQICGMAILMSKIFTVISILSMASLALPSMSGFMFYGYKLFNTPNSYFFYSGHRELFISISILIPVIGIGIYSDFIFSFLIDKVKAILSNFF